MKLTNFGKILIRYELVGGIHWKEVGIMRQTVNHLSYSSVAERVEDKFVHGDLIHNIWGNDDPKTKK